MTACWSNQTLSFQVGVQDRGLWHWLWGVEESQEGGGGNLGAPAESQLPAGDRGRLPGVHRARDMWVLSRVLILKHLDTLSLVRCHRLGERMCPPCVCPHCLTDLYPQMWLHLTTSSVTFAPRRSCTWQQWWSRTSWRRSERTEACLSHEGDLSGNKIFAT